MKKFKRPVGKKEHIRGTEIKIDCACDRNNKIKAVNEHTRMCGKEPKVFRIASPGKGLPKWKKR